MYGCKLAEPLILEADLIKACSKLPHSGPILELLLYSYYVYPKEIFSKLWRAFHFAFFFIKKIIFPFWNLIFVGSLFEDNWKKWIPGSSMGEIHNDGWWIRVKTDVKVHTSLDVTLKVRSRLFEMRKYSYGFETAEDKDRFHLGNFFFS